jgi:tetratricopeptide (TPR) repeat protein
MAEIPATITDDALLSRRYFEEAVRLNPGEARYLGFYASTLLAEGAIHKDEKLTRKAYFTLLDAIKAYPEFNYFTAGYVMSDRPRDSERFKEGLEYQWLNVDVCVGEKVDRRNPDYQKYMRLVTTEGPKRVCWNSWIAPHNFEGFFLNMGDMLVKSGDWQTAQKIYANARLSGEYAQWKFRDVLEERIVQAEANVAIFNAPPDARGRMTKPIMGRSTFSCMACHEN